MTTEITRAIVMDLLPVYLAGEASEETRAFVENYLKTDPELAETARRSLTAGPLGDIPVPLSKEKAMEAYMEAKRWMVVRTLGLALAGIITLMAAAAFVLVLLR